MRPLREKEVYSRYEDASRRAFCSLMEPLAAGGEVTGGAGGGGGGGAVVVGGIVVVEGGKVVVVVGGTVVVGGLVVGAELVVDSLIPTDAFSFDGSSDPPELRALATTRSAQATEIPTFQPVSFRLVQRRMSPTGKQKNRPGTIAHQVWYHGVGVPSADSAYGADGAFVAQAEDEFGCVVHAVSPIGFDSVG